VYLFILIVKSKFTANMFSCPQKGLGC